jgi:hypothetical protein
VLVAGGLTWLLIELSGDSPTSEPTVEATFDGTQLGVVWRF